jgi:hypothetical protein
MGHSDIGITMNNYTYLGLEDAAVEIVRMEAIESAGESSRRKKYGLNHFCYGIYLWLADTCDTVRKHLVMSA